MLVGNKVIQSPSGLFSLEWLVPLEPQSAFLQYVQVNKFESKEVCDATVGFFTFIKDCETTTNLLLMEA